MHSIRGYIKSLWEKQGSDQILTTSYGTLVNSGCNTVLKIFLSPQFAKKQRPTMGRTPENDQEILREEMNTSNTWSIYHNA
jgi:hypothetical protein